MGHVSSPPLTVSTLPFLFIFLQSSQRQSRVVNFLLLKETGSKASFPPEVSLIQYAQQMIHNADAGLRTAVMWVPQT